MTSRELKPYGNATCFPVQAGSRAAERISVTIMLISSEESPAGKTTEESRMNLAYAVGRTCTVSLRLGIR